ncbi:hypothetical protein HDC92_003087 [Pedobacter sp. AK017]|uniref:pentapeptide repeat-containing protein n=1 Tax=Pedobacter sp. AK017 TaxID=2723073 RepID=UPI00160F445E|nr:pentapeptide repeat-containing protein [Pedobacter sp. AK017]MBB5439394.1 hypothetical protein [Pedobacter sp. AK017]
MNKLKTENLVETFQGVEMGDLVLIGDQFKAKHITFHDANFNGDVHFEKTNLPQGISFQHAKFLGHVQFSDITSDYDSALQPEQQFGLVFEDCHFHNEVRFLGSVNDVNYHVKFERCTFDSELKITNMNISGGGIELSDCTISKDLKLIDINGRSAIILYNNVLNGSLHFSMIKAWDISFYGNNTFNGNVNIHNCDLKHVLSFRNVTIADYVHISRIRTSGLGLIISGSSFLQMVIVDFQDQKSYEPTGISGFNFSDTKFANGIQINGLINALHDKPKVQNITLDMSGMISGNITFNYLDVRRLRLSGYNSSASVAFRNVHFNELSIKTFVNDGGLILSDVKASGSWKDGEDNSRSVLKIEDSNLGKAQLLGSNFKSFDDFSLHNVILQDISTSMMTWPTFLQLDRQDIEKKKIELKSAKKSGNKEKEEEIRIQLFDILYSKKEINRQLKLAYQKQGDIPLSQKFQQREMKYYLLLNKYERPRRLSEYLILVSSQTNNFGQSWLKAFKLLILASFVCYMILAFLVTKRLDRSHFLSTWPEIYYNLKVFFYYEVKIWLIVLNPAHYLKDIDENIKGLSFWVYFADMFSRIVVSYFIFQVISAFRKFNKS